MIFAFYGSLRPGQYNFDRFDLKKEGKHVGTEVVGGYKMVSVNDWYPKVFESDNQDDKITVDFVEINNTRICQQIDGMEIGAGYMPKTIRFGDDKAVIYIADRKMSPRDIVIPSGDWVKYNTEKENDVATSTVS